MLSESERGEEKEADTGGRKQEEESNMHLHGVPVCLSATGSLGNMNELVTEPGF